LRRSSSRRCGTKPHRRRHRTAVGERQEVEQLAGLVLRVAAGENSGNVLGGRFGPGYAKQDFALAALLGVAREDEPCRPAAPDATAETTARELSTMSDLARTFRTRPPTGETPSCHRPSGQAGSANAIRFVAPLASARTLANGARQQAQSPPGY